MSQTNPMINNKERWFGQILSKYAIQMVLVLMIVMISLLSKDFLRPVNIINVLRAESARGMLAIGVGFVIITRGIDLSVGSIVALSSVISASLVQEANAPQKLFPNLIFDPTMAFILAIIAGLGVGIVFGAINGLLVAYTKIPPFIATLGSMVIAKGLALSYTDAYPVSMLIPEFRVIGQARIGGIPIVIFFFIIVVIIAWVMLNKMRFGKWLYAIGGNQNAARYCGINVEKNIIRVYVLSGVLAAIAGLIITARTGSGNAVLGEGYELDAIAAATIGGTSHSGGIGTIGGIVAGIFILGILNNGFLLLSVSPYMQQVIKGLIIIGAVVFDMRKNARKV